MSSTDLAAAPQRYQLSRVDVCTQSSAARYNLVQITSRDFRRHHTSESDDDHEVRPESQSVIAINIGQ